MFRPPPGICHVVRVRSGKSGVEPACGRQAAALQKGANDETVARTLERRRVEHPGFPILHQFAGFACLFGLSAFISLSSSGVI